MPPGSTTLLSCRSGKQLANSRGTNAGTLHVRSSFVWQQGTTSVRFFPGASPPQGRSATSVLDCPPSVRCPRKHDTLVVPQRKTACELRGTNAGTLHVRSSLVWQQGTTGVWFFLGAQPLQGRCATAASQVPQKVAQTTSSGVGAFSNPAFSGCSVKGFFNTS